MDEQKFLRLMHGSRDMMKCLGSDTICILRELGNIGSQYLNTDLVEVRDSPIAGKGLFAKQPILPGMVVAMYPADVVYNNRTGFGTSLIGLDYNVKEYLVNLTDEFGISGNPGILHGAGLAHMANEHPSLFLEAIRSWKPTAASDGLRTAELIMDYCEDSCNNNNASLVFGSHYCYIRACTALAAGDEVCVQYGIPYWTGSHTEALVAEAKRGIQANPLLVDRFFRCKSVFGHKQQEPELEVQVDDRFLQYLNEKAKNMKRAQIELNVARALMERRETEDAK